MCEEGEQLGQDYKVGGGRGQKDSRGIAETQAQVSPGQEKSGGCLRPVEFVRSEQKSFM